MSIQLNLQEIERKAFRSTYQDGLWDVNLGLIVAGMSIFIHRPAQGYSPMNIVLFLLTTALANSLFWIGKKYVTLPRMGLVRFGPVRKQKMRTLAVILGVFVLIQTGLVGLTALGWARPEAIAKWDVFLRDPEGSRLAVAAIGSLMVGISMMVNAFFSDFGRGYWIAFLMALAVFLMIYLNQPVWAVLIGGLIILPGLALFARFLKTYPLRREDSPHA
jgi:hypothetical protein